MDTILFLLLDASVLCLLLARVFHAPPPPTVEKGAPHHSWVDTRKWCAEHGHTAPLVGGGHHCPMCGAAMSYAPEAGLRCPVHGQPVHTRAHDGGEPPWGWDSTRCVLCGVDI